jgi:hypothetical protein
LLFFIFMLRTLYVGLSWKWHNFRFWGYNLAACTPKHGLWPPTNQNYRPWLFAVSKVASGASSGASQTCNSTMIVNYGSTFSGLFRLQARWVPSATIRHAEMGPYWFWSAQGAHVRLV